MEISRLEQFQIKNYNLEQVNIQKKREDDYRKLVERKNFEQLIAEQVAKNVRLDSDKGRNVDIEC